MDNSQKLLEPSPNKNITTIPDGLYAFILPNCLFSIQQLEYMRAKLHALPSHLLFLISLSAPQYEH